MSAEAETRQSRASQGTFPEGEQIRENVAARQMRGKIGEIVFFSSLLLGILALLTLLVTVADDTVGLVVVQNRVEPTTLTDGRPLEELSKEELITIVEENVSGGLFRQLDREQPFAERSQDDMVEVVLERVVRQEIVKSYDFFPSLFDRAAIDAEVVRRFPNGELEWRSWLNTDFLTSPMSSTPAFAGVRTAILGSLWVIAITMLVAFPIGVCAAIYLEEYATGGWLNNLIETNINNLAGVPSIIYGMLGLAIFVRALGYYTSGQFTGVIDANGRTIISAAMTMALLILPIIIINAREAIRAVSLSLRQASYGLGATKWQTVWHHVLPQALPGILTGTILGMSRAIGETAPLIVVGASTFIVFDPDGPFSTFTVLPIQIYNWTSQPSDQFRDIAAAAIIVLMTLLILLNTTAILLRNRFRGRV